MENGNNNRSKSFEEFRRQRSRPHESNERGRRRLFETDWEVFVARLDRETGKYVNLTFCCENAVSRAIII